MKKLFVFLAAALMVLAFAVSCKSNEDKAVDLVEKMISAAKADNVPAFVDAMYELHQLEESLSDEEAKEIDKVLTEKFPRETDRALVDDFSQDHVSEILEYAMSKGYDLN